jgi:hypothetical protein
MGYIIRETNIACDQINNLLCIIYWLLDYWFCNMSIFNGGLLILNGKMGYLSLVWDWWIERFLKTCTGNYESYEARLNMNSISDSLHCSSDFVLGIIFNILQVCFLPLQCIYAYDTVIY